MMPYRRNPFLTGRKRLLSTLKLKLEERKGNQWNHQVALFGLGGVGKTQVAIEYVYSNRNYYTSIFWVNAANQAALLSGFQEIASTTGCLNITDNLNPGMLSKAVKKWFAAQKQWLLVIDNLDDITVIRLPDENAARIPEYYLPQPDDNGHILITTRNPNSNGIPAIGLEVEVLECADAVEYLLKRSNLVTEDTLAVEAEAQRIVEELGCLPLAIEQTAAYIREVCRDIFEFLPRYHMNKHDIHRRMPSGNQDYPESVATAWLLSFDSVRKREPSTAKLLQLFAFLNPDFISKEFLKRGLQGLSDDVREIVRHDDTFDMSLLFLEESSLIKRSKTGKGLTIHRLVQSVLKSEMNAVDDFNVVSKGNEEWISPEWKEIVDLIMEAFPELDYGFTNVIECRQLQDQVIAPLVAIPEFNWKGLRKIWCRVGWFLLQDGKFKDAELFFDKVRHTCSTYKGERDVETLIAMDYLGRVYREQGRYEAAMKIANAILDVESCPDYVVELAKDILQGAYISLQRYVEALPLQVARSEACKTRYGDRHITTLTAMSNLATTYERLNQIDKSVSLLEEVLERTREIYGDAHVETMIKSRTLGYIYVRSERPEAVELGVTMLERAGESMKAALGIDHPETLIAFNHLAWCYNKQGRYPETSSMLENIIDRFKTVFGPKHEQTFTAIRYLGDSWSFQNRFAEAISLLETTLEFEGDQEVSTYEIDWAKKYLTFIIRRQKLAERKGVEGEREGVKERNMRRSSSWTTRLKMW